MATGIFESSRSFQELLRRLSSVYANFPNALPLRLTEITPAMQPGRKPPRRKTPTGDFSLRNVDCAIDDCLGRMEHRSMRRSACFFCLLQNLHARSAYFKKGTNLVRSKICGSALVVAFLCLTASLAHVEAQTERIAPASAATAGRRATGLAEFEYQVKLARQLGATDVLITDGLPVATWEMDPSDPYPMWFVHHASLLKDFPPPEVQPYVNMPYAEQVQKIVQDRCAVLLRYGMKAVWNDNEPAVMPEAFFAAYPQLRGPRIDQPNRSRRAYFAPTVDDPETLRMYRESIQLLLKACPAVEQFNWVTTDAGSGFDWAPSLYPGINGNSRYKGRPMSDRVAGFLINAQQAAKEAGHEVRIDLTPIPPRPWMIPTFSPDVLREIIRQLPRGLAVEGQEGPDGRPFEGVQVVSGGSGAFYPVVGLVVPSIEGPGQSLPAPSGAGSARFMVNFGEPASADFTFRLLKATLHAPMRTLQERVATLRSFAAGEAGEAQADNLIEAWMALNDAERSLQALDFGSVLRMGDVLNRWITRPMVPFPEELTEEEKKDYRPFLFQAKGEAQANDLIDIQAMRMYEGWGARLLFQRTIEITLPQLQKALQLVQGIAQTSTDERAQQQWELTGKRLQAVICLLQSANNMVAYQAQLDRVKALGEKPEINPVLGTESSWDRTDLMETARKEIDAMAALNQLLKSTKEPILDLAPTPEEETVMRLGPNITAQIQHKIDVMNAHWRDYDRLFTSPNP
jgi:hypothetical protein